MNNAETFNPNPPKNQYSTPRARVILEFIEGDLSRPPIVYPVIDDGTDEQDEKLCRAILERWGVA